jgi:hypothetical protein
MKTSEEKLNEALRQALKRKFDDFEDQPNPSSYSQIRTRLKQPRNFKYLFFTILFVGLFVGSIVIDQHWVRRKSASNPKSVTRTESGTRRELAEPIVTGRGAGIMQKEHVKSSVSNSLQTNALNPGRKPDRANAEPLTRSPINTVSDRSIVGESVAVTPEATFMEQQNPGTGMLSDQHPVLENSATTAGVSEPENELSELPGIGMLEPEGVKFEKMNFPKVELASDSKTSQLIHATSGKIGWLLHVASLKTYQIITVPKTNGSDFQNFKFPSAFSLETLGYKVSGGLEKSGFQLMLHYSLFRQAYSYEIAGNEYVVNSVEDKNFQVVRRGKVVNENRKMELLGIGINKQVLWGKSPLRKYYATGGVEYSHILRAKRYIGWVSLGAGRQIRLNNQALIQVGPYAEFSPVKVPGSGDPFYYQPYRVGISLGLKLIKP